MQEKIMDSDPQHIDRLMVRYLQGTCTKEEREELMSWINASEENESALFEMKELFESRQRIDTSQVEKEKHNPGKGNRYIWNQWIRYAAIIAVLFGGSFLFYFISNKSQPEVLSVIRQMVIHNTRGVYSLTLPDSSKVWLHGGTTLTYPEYFTDSIRQVDLEGEAYFAVQADSVYPFIVKTHAAKIRATGTEFNITAYPGDQVVTTTLVKGEVDIHPNKQKTPIKLKPSQQAMVAESSAQIKNLSANTAKGKSHVLLEKEKIPMIIQDIDTELFTDWKDGVYRFREEPFRNIALRLEKMYGMDIRIESRELQNALFSGMFDENYSLKEVFSIINISNPITYRIENKTVYIKNK